MEILGDIQDLIGVETLTEDDLEEAERQALANAQNPVFSVEEQAVWKNQLVRYAELRRRLADGTFGLCDVCHRPISCARLRAYPFATTCVDCPPTE